MPSSIYIPILVAGMIITGSTNSLWTKWQDMQCVENCDDPNPKNRILYEQPVWQTLQMFLGEMLCFLPVLFAWLRTRWQSHPVQLPSDAEEQPISHKPTPRELRGWKVFLLWLPAACDLTGTTLMNVGLLYTPVSIYQMTRGALVLFVGIMSVVFLGRRLWLYQWVSLITVMTGVFLVGLCGSLIKDTSDESTVTVLARAISILANAATSPEPIEAPELTKVVIGVFFILFAQVFTAAQFAIEEEILGKYAIPPLLAVGYEGLFGTISILLLMPILSIPSISSKSTFFDLPRGWHQMINTPTVLWASIVIACSISLFNYFGLSVTRHVSATARSLIDTCRTLSIWIISVGLGWEKILFPITLLQILGFGLLVYGTFLFNGLAKPPPFLRPPPPLTEEGEEEEEALLSATAVLPADLGASGYDVLPEGTHARTSQHVGS